MLYELSTYRYVRRLAHALVLKRRLECLWDGPGLGQINLSTLHKMDDGVVVPAKRVRLEVYTRVQREMLTPFRRARE